MNWWKQNRTKLNRSQMLLTQTQWNQLVKNGKNRDQDHVPVARFFATWSPANWTLSEIELHHDEDGNLTDVIGFGLCDLGMGCPELGYVSLNELVETSRKSFRTQIERDQWFRPNGKPLSTFARQDRLLQDQTRL